MLFPMSEMEQILAETRTIAVVGLSSNPMRPSFGVTEYMQNAGYKIVPVNPKEENILGEKCFAALEDVPVPVDCVNVFRQSDAVPEVVESAIRIGAKSIWLQLGVSHPEAEAKARAAGLQVVSDRCILVEHGRWKKSGSSPG